MHINHYHTKISCVDAAWAFRGKYALAKWTGVEKRNGVTT